MFSATMGVRSCGLCTGLRSVAMSFLAVRGCQKRVLHQILGFLLISCVTEKKDANEINTLLAPVILNACAHYL